MTTMRKKQLQVARLEDRTVPTVFSAVSANELFVWGSPSTRTNELRVVASTESVRVFDGATLVAAHKPIKNIDVRPDANTKVALDMGIGVELNQVSVRLGRGSNSLRMENGNVNSVTVIGGSGADQISAIGVSIGQFTANLGVGADSALLARSKVSAMAVRSTESITIAGSATADIVTLENSLSPMNVNFAGRILGDLNVSSAGGTLAFAGAVNGSVAFSHLPSNGVKDVTSETAIGLKFSGFIGKSLIMLGSTGGDTAFLTVGSHIFGDVVLRLGDGNDDVALAGSIGSSQMMPPNGNRPIATSQTVLAIDFGAGHDSMTVMESAKITAPKTNIAMGAGNDRFAIAKGSYFTWLNVDGGDGKDTLENPSEVPNVNATGFEVFA